MDSLASGVHLGVHPCAGPKLLAPRSYSERVDSLDPGWLPKKSGLTLANYRAAPSRIALAPGRNREIVRPAGESAPRAPLPKDTRKLASSRAFCPCEKCPPDTLLGDAQHYGRRASSITRRLDRLELNRRLLSVSAITQSP